MKFLHTADLHLEAGNELDALGWLITKAEELGVKGIIIAGDLFNSDKDASILRSQVAAMANRTDFRFFVIPGNHDSRSYSQEYDYGKNVMQLVSTPYQMTEYEGIQICGVPYAETRFNTCLQDLHEQPDILIAHGTLYDQSFIFSMLDDIETRYMPILPGHLENRARYVALGHLHARFIAAKYGDTHVVYPGSPTALDTKCTEPRACSLITIDKNTLEVEKVLIDSAPYWVRKIFYIFPGIEERALQEIENFLNNLDPNTSLPYIAVRGYTAEKDRTFKERALKMIEPYLQKFVHSKIEIEPQPWDIIIEHKLVRDFVDKSAHLEQTTRIKLLELMFPIFNDILK
jgi:DNA repair exonuclease SbcCD nuclease subunit